MKKTSYYKVFLIKVKEVLNRRIAYSMVFKTIKRLKYFKLTPHFSKFRIGKTMHSSQMLMFLMLLASLLKELNFLGSEILT